MGRINNEGEAAMKQPVLEEGRFVRRYKRFFAEIETREGLLVAHVANTGSLKSCLVEGAPCLFERHDDPKRKLKASLEMIRLPTTWVGVNTSRANQLVKQALQNRKLCWEPHHEVLKPEFKLSAETRLDFALWGGQETPPPFSMTDESIMAKWRQRRPHFVEVKSVTYGEGSTAFFPDAQTVRGQKHLQELMALKQNGFSVELLFVVQRTDTTQFAPADEIDPEYARLLREALSAGVKVTQVQGILGPEGFWLKEDSYREVSL